ncbi:hypothetical protein PR202_gb27730 [Eleusine coracana subsp. coracana]|uniref:DUF4408 domain-containing protein n=1 Tax=Eleusine coracana subsp. coracana TaxID=191504 RepID=A0AAV5FW25_ELECO|nr:hypothetical protein PR202_gb27730 [Eleusine coracana subsp. coracana]
MLEEAIPALWSAVNGFFTPAVLFILLNVVIGTIAVTSKSSAPPAAAAERRGESASAVVEGGVEHQPQQRRLSRVPSMAFERLRSFNLSRFAAPAPETAAVDGVVDLGYEQPPAPAAPEKEKEAEAAVEPEPEHAHAHMERSRSEAAADLEVPRLPARLHKSASEKSAFGHFEAAEVEEAVQAVEKRRPATTRDGAAGRRGRRLPVKAAPVDSESDSEVEEEEQVAGGEVDAQAENFINRFHNQLKLQRMESILRYRENIRHGQAAAAAAGGV